MDISVIGASGACGREIVIQLIRDRLLEQREILQLVASNPHSSHPYWLHGFRADLQDAYAEIIPQLDVTDDPGAIIGDVVIMAGGATIAADPQGNGIASRDALAACNRPVFERFAQALGAARRHSPPVVIVVTNPVELGVHLFAQHLPRDCVLGMGAHSDSLRFRWEIAHDLGIRRQLVRGYMLGEHGAGMVPLWSSVRVHGLTRAEWTATERRLRRGVDTADFPAVLAAEQQRLVEMLQQNPVSGPAEALRHVATLPPDLRVALKPFAIHYTAAKTLEATANATLELVRAICEGRPTEIVAQYQHAGEAGLHVPFGARLIVAGAVERWIPIEGYWREEMELIQHSAEGIQAKLTRWLATA
ncbi:MAG TPA: malate dehydrogenase [Candidatus Competibacteraceae bacterium]|nr:MAG: malate dehydrogenase [Candidatus Competibacteraceae bacterium]HOB62530.1 malate dehydrogenase [Candidatus Competibacteraceae bacterium]HQA25580.1 malate dehydrogenase [Candidatus Competibacteraceae bacterium]HQD56508.1 malate dehydrogenase [Candidatus Competibacteraceae bacterium]